MRSIYISRKLVACTLLVVCLLSYISDTPAETKGASIKTVINQDGWEIPGLAQSKIVGQRSLSQAYRGNSPQVYLTVLNPRHEVVSKISFFGLQADSETLIVWQKLIAIRAIARYDVNGHVFCYSVQGVSVSYNPQTRRGGYGGQFSMLYYDNDGDGKFESFAGGDGALGLTPRIPNWVLKYE